MRIIPFGFDKAKKLDLLAIGHKVLDEIERNVENIGKREYNKGTVTWDTEVEFQTQKLRRANSRGTKVFTTNRIYRFVHEGTDPHPIGPVRAKSLAYPEVYTPKTTPGSNTSGGGGPSGPTVFPLPIGRSVQHPGTEPRNQTESVIKDVNIDKLVDDFFDKVKI